ncbi:MAG: hypothetical protein M3Q44_04105 [bacterium]|nr:hypothetical protein [bacterium]
MKLLKTQKSYDKNVLHGGIFEVDQSNRIEDETKKSFIAIANDVISFCIEIPISVKKKVYKAYVERLAKKFYAPEVFAKAIVTILEDTKLIPARLNIDIEYPGYEEKITEVIKQYNKEIEINFRRIGKHSNAHILAYSFGGKRNKHKNKIVIPLKGTEARLHPESTGIRRRTRP